MGLLQLIPLFFLFAFIGTFAWVGYQMYLYTTQLSERGATYLEKKHNISYSSTGGMKFGVKQKTDEEYSGGIQSGLVNMWNESRWPDYKSRFWNKEAQKEVPSKDARAAPPTGSRSASSRSISGSKTQ